ncbi:hypothetical protein C0995_003190 [Termitomyces sp. Mi166|nr:hypothetical protein C0995_003190 [Termitomyces sp. Mi166\
MSLPQHNTPELSPASPSQEWWNKNALRCQWAWMQEGRKGEKGSKSGWLAQAIGGEGQHRRAAACATTRSQHLMLLLFSPEPLSVTPMDFEEPSGPLVSSAKA